MTATNFFDPRSKKPLLRNKDGDLYLKNKIEKIIYKNYEGCIDFVHKNKKLINEKKYYEEIYSNRNIHTIDEKELKSFWYNFAEPWYTTLLQSLGKLDGKNLLILGNGVSLRELYFYCQGANVFYTDLSISAVKICFRYFF